MYYDQTSLNYYVWRCANIVRAIAVENAYTISSCAHTLHDSKDHVELVFSPASRAMSVVAGALIRATLRLRIRYRGRGCIQIQTAA
jgi:hypothetical protein